MIYIYICKSFEIFDDTHVFCFATGSSFTLDATPLDLTLPLMLRYLILPCSWCYAAWPYPGLDATALDLTLPSMLRCLILPCPWRYAAWSYPALDAMLLDPTLPLMLRFLILPCPWCYATWSSLVSSGWGWVRWGGDDTLLDLLLHLMLRRLILACPWCYAAWSPWCLRYLILHCPWCYAAWPYPALDATLLDSALPLMLRYLILPCPWCYAAWSYPALDATLLDPTLPLMLRYLIFSCFFWVGWSWVGWGGDDTTHVSCFATGSSFTRDATPLDLSLPLMLCDLPLIFFAVFSWTRNFGLAVVLLNWSWLLQTLWNMLRSARRPFDDVSPGGSVFDFCFASSLGSLSLSFVRAGGRGWCFLGFPNPGAYGAKCYPPLRSREKMWVRQCFHGKGVFSVKKWVRWTGDVNAHTGGVIDSLFSFLEGGVPNKLACKCGSKQNPNIQEVSPQCPMALGDGQRKFVGQNRSTAERLVSSKTGWFNSHRF